MRSNYAQTITEKVMTITKEFVAKALVAFVAVAMVVGFFAPAAKAQTTEELQQMINDLLAQVAALQSSAGQGTSVASGVCPYTWTRDLAQGATGADVMKLQQFLNADPDTRVSASGVGSAGMETEYYGPATAAAVSKLQVKYRSEILSPANLVNPTGYFGPSTRGKVNALCVAAPVTETPADTTDEDTSSSDDSKTTSLSGEASLDTFELDSADDDTIEEGSDDAELGTFQVTFTNGDASISRLDIALTNTTVGADAWNAFDTVSLWVDGDKVAEEDASSRSDYLGDEDNGVIRFSGLDIVGMEDEELSIVVAANIQNGLDTEELSTWTLGADSLRFFDGEGVATTEDGTLVTSDTETFDLVEAGTDDEIVVKTSSNDPDATTLQVETDKKSDWYNVFTFDLDTKDSVNDITLNKVMVTVVVSSSTFDGLVDDYELVIDGTTIDKLAVTTGTTGTGKYDDAATVILTFDVDNDVVIDAGDRVEAELNLRFKSLAAGDEGDTIQAKVTAADADTIDAEGADTLGTAQLSGAATGETHTLRTAGIDTTMTDDSAVVTNVDSAHDYATYEIEVEVTAFEQDVYLNVDDTVSTSWSLEDSTGAAVATGTRLVVLDSSADIVNGYYEITEGSTETVTLTVTYTPGAAETARLVLNSLTFDDDSTGSGTTKTQSTLPSTDYRTSVVAITD